MNSPATTENLGFELGNIYITPGAIDALVESNQHAQEFLERHGRGDWGELDGAPRSAEME